MPNQHSSHDSERPSPSSTALAALTLTVQPGGRRAAVLAQPAPAAAGAVVDFRIAAGPLAPALRQLASTANILLTFTAEQTEGKRTAGVNGRHPAAGALSLLLAGSGLRAVQLDNGAFVLRVDETLAPAASDTATLPLVTVTGATVADGTTEGTDSYTTSSMSTATRLNLSMRETPQSITVITSESRIRTRRRSTTWCRLLPV